MSDCSSTPEQAAIIEAITTGSHVRVNAYAGCAKTSTIGLAVRAILMARPSLRILCLAFNVSIKKELEASLGPLADVKTLNGLGHSAIGRALGRSITLDADKIYGLCRAAHFKGDDLQTLKALVNEGRMAGILPAGQKPGLRPDTLEWWKAQALSMDVPLSDAEVMAVAARAVLKESFDLACRGTIDFTDQIYISALAFGAFPRYDLVLVDEAQDLSPLNHRQLAKLPGQPQLVGVGDRHQAIYAFRGADHASMDNILSLRPQWEDRALTQTFRCPRAVVSRQHTFIPDFKAAPGNPHGAINDLCAAPWTPSGGSSAAILCRNNAPLLRLAFQCLSAHVPINFTGRDLTASLKRLYLKLNRKGDQPLAAVVERCHAEAAADPKGGDKYLSLATVLTNSSSIEDALSFLSQPKRNAITLSTGHKAKGLEWDTIFFLEPGLLPDPLPAALLDGNAQEHNLRYVIETRTKSTLNFCTLDTLNI